MAWTDERVAKLTKLWADGLSASQIAAELGEVTRNAVIGKVHRLGLSGRAKPKNAGGRPKRKDADNAGGARVTPITAGSRSGGMAAAFASGSRPMAGATATAAGAATMGATALKIEPEYEETVEPRFQQAEDVVVPMSKKLTLLELTENTCKWPHGDPQRPGFSFCGHATKEGTPYCEHHAKVSYQDPAERRRRR